MYESDIQKLERVAKTLYGGEWRRPLARALAPYRPEPDRRGKPLPESSLYAWLDGGRPIPSWVIGALPLLARDRAAEFNVRGKAARSLALELSGLSQADLMDARRKVAEAVA